MRVCARRAGRRTEAHVACCSTRQYSGYWARAASHRENHPALRATQSEVVDGFGGLLEREDPLVDDWPDPTFPEQLHDRGPVLLTRGPGPNTRELLDEGGDREER